MIMNLAAGHTLLTNAPGSGKEELTMTGQREDQDAVYAGRRRPPDDQAAAARVQAELISREAWRAACSAIERIAALAGAQTVHDPGPGGLPLPRPDARTGIRAAARLELAARLQLRDYIRYARQDGLGWHEIGALLDLGAEAADRGLPLDEAAFRFAASQPAGPGQAATFTWTCRACGQCISDRGPGHHHPAGDEPGHATGCARLAAAAEAATARPQED
jgi:hypothetical protein